MQSRIFFLQILTDRIIQFYVWTKSLEKVFHIGQFFRLIVERQGYFEMTSGFLLFVICQYRGKDILQNLRRRAVFMKH